MRARPSRDGAARRLGMRMTPVAAKTIVVQRIEDPAAFQALREEWDELLAASLADSFFLTWEWLYAWWTHLAGDRRLFLLVARQGGRLVAIAPLSLRARRVAGVLPLRSVEFLGADRLSSDYLDVIVRRGWEAEAIPALAQYLADARLALELASVRRAGCAAAALSRALTQRRWRMLETPTAVCPFIDLSGHTWESYLGTLESKPRNDFLRLLKNLTKKFSVRLEPASSEPQRREFMVHLVRLHNLRWQNLGGSDALHTADLVAFHDEVSRVTLERGWLRLFVLWLDGQPVASLYGFRYGRTFYFVQTGFDPAYGRHAVGLITVGLTIKSAIAEGAEEYDFLRGDEAYKFRWAREVRHLATLEVYPRGAPELLYRRTQRLTAVAKRIARQTLPRTVIDRVIAARQRRFQILASR
ncbi:MAG: hypothetical protein DMD93_22635 [Candidatus Rokuibacteriota bacterium]|nr:MAG: hypothetical protein DMD93_22635 [Candidatus Rokubacteria bacterium]